MQRRSFLKAAASAAPAVALQNFLVGQAHASQANSTLQVVGAAQDRYGHPTSLGTGPLVVKVATGETEGRLFIVEHPRLMPGGPPLHLHLNQEEWFHVEEGKVDFQVGDRRLRLHAGESVLAPRRVPHTFSSVGSAPSRLMIAFCPAGKMEQFFRDEQNPKAPTTDSAFWRRYEMELVGPSPFWKS